METVKIIGRLSQFGKEYLQTAINVEGQENNEFIPVYLKKGVEKLNYVKSEKKIDKRGKEYTLYEVDARNVFMPVDEETKKVKKAIVCR